MKVTIQVVIERDDEPPIVDEIACLERERLVPDTLGLTAGHAREAASGDLCGATADLPALRRATPA